MIKAFANVYFKLFLSKIKLFSLNPARILALACVVWVSLNAKKYVLCLSRKHAPKATRQRKTRRLGTSS